MFFQRILFLFVFFTSCTVTLGEQQQTAEQERVERDAFITNIVGQYTTLNRQLSFATSAGTKKLFFDTTGTILITSDSQYTDIPISITIIPGGATSEIQSISRKELSQGSSLVVDSTISATANNFFVVLNNSTITSEVNSQKFTLTISGSELLLNGTAIAYKTLK